MTGLTELDEEAGLLWKTYWKMMDVAALGGGTDRKELDQIRSKFNHLQTEIRKLEPDRPMNEL
jgi:hypothetical protein